ncbi:helix-turn-helix domain-containing protein [Kineococcus sp. SYSU DK006]|uniref:helix-turn-helix domain-containing protein n=1 Tax=Kineococcus sp. SYSU DK006 TaxID=3383127 RepID=UPI003D7C8729
MIADVVALVGTRVAPFELGIVCQVFGLDRSEEGLPTYDFSVCAVTRGEVPTTSGFPVVVPHGLDRLLTADLVAVPAWPDLDAPVDPRLLDALRAAVERGARVLTVCSGTFALAATGMLDGRRATTHWQVADLLARAHPQVHVERDLLHVEDGPFLTSAGAAAGIDACLHVVRQEHGAAVANALARRMVVPAQRSGGQAQYVEAPLPPARAPQGAEALSHVIDWARAHLHEPLDVAALAARAHVAPRTFARRFRQATGTTPHRWLLQERLLLAEQLLETTELTVEAVARRSGLGSPDNLRHHFAARRGVPPLAHRRSFRQQHS